MKFISVVALLAPVVLATTQATNAGPTDAWISLLKQQCTDISEQCLDLAKKVHQPQFDVLQAGKAAVTYPGCIPAYATCIRELSVDSSDGPLSAAQGNLVTCLLQIAPDHIKYFLDNDSADIPILASQNCALRELHRVAHVELGPLA